jgi:hypothetical protein
LMFHAKLGASAIRLVLPQTPAPKDSGVPSLSLPPYFPTGKIFSKILHQGPSLTLRL